MQLVQIDNWQDYLSDGEKFLQTANGAFSKKAKAFSPEALYNIICMAIEKLIMAFLMRNGDLAENHTMGDLLIALERHLDCSKDFADKLNYLDTFQEICALENYTVVIPTEKDILTFLNIGNEVQALLLPHMINKEGVVC